MRPATLDLADIGQLMPMHLVLAEDGVILSGGLTMRKLAGDARRIDEAFLVERPHPGSGCLAAEALFQAATTGERVFLRQTHPPHAVLRGHAVKTGDGRLVVNMGFGIGLPQSVRQMNLTDADFAPSDLAMELLFLHEANAAALAALSRYNSRLDEARQAAMLESTTDPLTGLANRRGLEAAVSAAARAARPQQGGGQASRRVGDARGFVLLHLDLDGFKAVNDSRGHAVGDTLLQHVAAILREETRASDTVARPGGDEFVLVLGGLESRHALTMLASRIIARICVPVPIEGVAVRVSASIGAAASVDYQVLDPRQMAEDADAALYAAKRAGRSCSYIVRPGHPPVAASAVGGRLVRFDAGRAG